MHSGRGRRAKRKASTKLMREESSDSDEIEQARQSAAEDGEIEEVTETSQGEEGELTAEENRAMLDAVVAADVKGGGKQVAQKDVRYFMMDNVVCENCGIKGHLSYDCAEVEEEKGCNSCGKVGHGHRNCPNELCFICQRPGHKARDCDAKRGDVKRRRVEVRRDVRPPRMPQLHCYVCGRTDHLDCGLARLRKGNLSCYNCGMMGHAGEGCNLPSVERVIPIVMELERERKEKQKHTGKKKTGGKKGKKDEEKDGKTEQADSKAAEEFRDLIFERIRKRRYGRGER